MVQLLQNLADKFADFAQGMVRGNSLLRLKVREHPTLILKPSPHLQSSRRIRGELNHYPFALARFFSKLLEFYNPKEEHHVEESRTYLRSCRRCCSALHNAHIAGTFGNIRHRGVCWPGTSLLWSLSTRRSTNLPAQLLLSPL